ncbi:MAG: sulfatase-like hydrolase/transferase [Pirellulaceae bacterium]
MNPPRSSIVVTFDRLGSGYLGPYGNTWIETPNFNQLASESCLFEFATAQSPCLEATYGALWSGRHVLAAGETAIEHALPALLTSSGVTTSLITDEPALLAHRLAAGFSETIPLAPETLRRLADDESRTQMARLFATALDYLETDAGPRLLWIHCRGMQGGWDAPYALRNQFADEEDPNPPTFLDPPSELLPAGYDPDDLLGAMHAYAGQVVLADMCLGALLDAVRQSGGDSPLLVVAGTRGFALGEHGAVGQAGDALLGEVLQTPLLVRMPDGVGATRRSTALVQSPDLFTTLLDWHAAGAAPDDGVFGESLLPVVRGEAQFERNVVCSAYRQERSIRTPAWFLRRADQQVQLYVKPDDRWEYNEVSDRCGDVVAALLERLEACERELVEQGRISLQHLQDVLLHGYE